jgi:acetoin utilization deacetylase AcuC-like enzyme
MLIRQTSFFSRYTKDIVSFADQYTGGKIVSVLEGGYSDRALTSAAMGHVIGMLNEKGTNAWCSEPELINVSRWFTSLFPLVGVEHQHRIWLMTRSKNQSNENEMDD